MQQGTKSVADDVELFFQDTGAVDGSEDYTTIIALHGAGFNGNTFKRLVPLAGPSNARLVLLNRRGYCGSSPFAPAETEQLVNGEAQFMQDRAVELARFLAWFVTEHELPTAKAGQDGRKKGGVVLLGWSMGNATVLSLLGQEVPVATTATLAPYLHTIVLYDAPGVAHGYKPPPEFDPSVSILPYKPTAPDPVGHFARVVSSRYSHPCFASAATAPHSLSSDSGAGLDLVGSSATEPTTDKLSTEEKEAMMESGDPLKSDMGMYGRMQGALIRQTERALFEQAPSLADARVVALYTRQGLWAAIWATGVSLSRHDTCRSEGKDVRMYTAVGMEGNHFVHWEEPERFWSVLREGVGW